MITIGVNEQFKLAAMISLTDAVKVDQILTNIGVEYEKVINKHSNFVLDYVVTCKNVTHAAFIKQVLHSPLW